MDDFHKKLLSKKNQRGQAAVEYIIIFATMSFVGYKFVGSFKNFLGENVGNINKALTLQLRSGVCKTRCFREQYENGY
jgi:hypothetical protein